MPKLTGYEIDIEQGNHSKVSLLITFRNSSGDTKIEYVVGSLDMVMEARKELTIAEVYQFFGQKILDRVGAAVTDLTKFAKQEAKAP